MKKLLLLILLVPGFAKAQTFFVDGKDRKSVEVVQQKIAYLGYTLSDSASAQYMVHLLLDGTYRIGFKRPYEGYIKIIDSKTGSEVTRTKVKKQHPTALNGYNAAYGIFSSLTKKYLADELKKCKL